MDKIFSKKQIIEENKETEIGIIDDKKIENAIKKIEKDPALKRIYDSWFGKTDSKGNGMQTKFLEFVAKNPNTPPVYRKETEEFEQQNYSGFN